MQQGLSHAFTKRCYPPSSAVANQQLHLFPIVSCICCAEDAGAFQAVSGSFSFSYSETELALSTSEVINGTQQSWLRFPAVLKKLHTRPADDAEHIILAAQVAISFTDGRAGAAQAAAAPSKLSAGQLLAATTASFTAPGLSWPMHMEGGTAQASQSHQGSHKVAHVAGQAVHGYPQQCAYATIL